VGSESNVTFYDYLRIDLGKGIVFSAYVGFTDGMDAMAIGLLGQDGFFDRYNVEFRNAEGIFTVESASVEFARAAINNEGAKFMRRFPITDRFIESKPQFKLRGPGRPPNLSEGQRTIIFDCLAAVEPRCISLDALADDCVKRGYKTKHPIRRSILYHLNRMEAVQLCRLDLDLLRETIIDKSSGFQQARQR
jgi:hypothetical protein